MNAQNNCQKTLDAFFLKKNELADPEKEKKRLEKVEKIYGSEKEYYDWNSDPEDEEENENENKNENKNKNDNNNDNNNNNIKMSNSKNKKIKMKQHNKKKFIDDECEDDEDSDEEYDPDESSKNASRLLAEEEEEDDDKASGRRRELLNNEKKFKKLQKKYKLVKTKKPETKKTYSLDITPEELAKYTPEEQEIIKKNREDEKKEIKQINEESYEKDSFIVSDSNISYLKKNLKPKKYNKNKKTYIDTEKDIDRTEKIKNECITLTEKSGNEKLEKLKPENSEYSEKELSLLNKKTGRDIENEINETKTKKKKTDFPTWILQNFKFYILKTLITIAILVEKKLKSNNNLLDKVEQESVIIEGNEDPEINEENETIGQLIDDICAIDEEANKNLTEYHLAEKYKDKNLLKKQLELKIPFIEPLDEYFLDFTLSLKTGKQTVTELLQLVGIDKILENKDYWDFPETIANEFIVRVRRLYDDNNLPKCLARDVLNKLQVIERINQNINMITQTEYQMNKMIEILFQTEYHQKLDDNELVYNHKKHEWVLVKDADQEAEFREKLNKKNEPVKNYFTLEKTEYIEKKNLVTLLTSQEIETLKKKSIGKTAKEYVDEPEQEHEFKKITNKHGVQYENYTKEKFKPRLLSDGYKADGMCFGFIIHMDQDNYYDDPEKDKEIHMPHKKLLVTHAFIFSLSQILGQNREIAKLIVNHEHGTTKKKCHIQGFIKFASPIKCKIHPGAFKIENTIYTWILQNAQFPFKLEQYCKKKDVYRNPVEQYDEFIFMPPLLISKFLENPITANQLNENNDNNEEDLEKRFPLIIAMQRKVEGKDLIRIGTEKPHMIPFILQNHEKIMKFNKYHDEIELEKQIKNYKWEMPDYAKELLNKPDEKIWNPHEQKRKKIFKIIENWMQRYCIGNNKKDFSYGTRKKALCIGGARGIGKTVLINNLIQPNEGEHIYSAMENPYIIYLNNTIDWDAFKQKEKTAQLLVLDDVAFNWQKQNQMLKQFIAGMPTTVKSNYVDNGRWIYSLPCVILLNEPGTFNMFRKMDIFNTQMIGIWTNQYLGEPGTAIEELRKQEFYIDSDAEQALIDEENKWKWKQKQKKTLFVTEKKEENAFDKLKPYKK